MPFCFLISGQGNVLLKLTNDYPSHLSKDRSLIKETDNKQRQYMDGILRRKIKTLSKAPREKDML